MSRPICAFVRWAWQLCSFGTGIECQLRIRRLGRSLSADPPQCPHVGTVAPSSRTSFTRLALAIKSPVHIFSVALGSDADLEVLRLLSEATNSTFNKATEKDLAQILERFGKYF